MCACRNTRELATKFAVSVVDQIFWAFAEGSRLAELLSRPGVGGCIGHTDVNYLARAQFDG